MKWVASIFAAGGLFTANALEFQFQVSVENAGTKIIGTKNLPDGKLLIYPGDEFDLAEKLKPAIAEFRKKRKANSILEAQGIFKKFSDSSVRVEFILMAREVLDSKELSENFYEHYDAEMENVKKILSLWVIYSQDISKVKLWNQAMRAEARDSESRVEKYDVFTFAPKPKDGPQAGSYNVSIEPSIFQKERGIGCVDFGRSIGLDPAMQLDIPLMGRPGTSLDSLTKDAEAFLKILGDGIEQYDTRVLQNDLRLYLGESVLRHEIKTRWFHQSMPEAIPNALARYALGQIVLASTDDSQHSTVHKAMGLISPATPDLAQLIRDLENLKWNELPPETVSAEVQRAYSYFLMGAMFNEVTSEQWKIFRRMPKVKLKDPSQFFAYVKEVYPEFEAGFSVARDLQLNELRMQIAKADKTQKKAKLKLVPDSPRPANYEISQFDGLTIQHPDFLKEAVAEIGPVWGKGFKEARIEYNKIIAKRPWLETQKATDAELDHFRALGLKRPPRNIADQWAEILIQLAEADRLFSTLFTGDIHIWMKEDVQKIIRGGGKLKGFSLDDAKNSVGFSADFGHLLNGLSYEDMKKPGAIEAMGTVMLPVILKQEEVEGKSKNQLVKLLQADEFVGSIQKGDFSAEALGELFGMSLLGMTEEFCFATLIHELAEAVISENLIASADRRWFTDGMATYIACEMTDARFGDDAGWRQLEKLYQVNQNKRDELLKEVKLFEWKAGEDQDQPGEGDPSLLSNARYYYSARAIRKAVEGQSDDFLKRWHKEIGKNRWNRATSQTVIDAYDRLTDGDLKAIVESITTDNL